jgi:hypothetical protein
LTRASLPRRGCARRFPTSLTTCSGESRIADRGGGGGGLELGIRNPRMLGGGRAGEDGRWGGGHEFGRRKQCVRARSRLVGDGEFRWWWYPCGAPCSPGLSPTTQQYFSLTAKQALATSQQYSCLRTNQHQPSATSQPNRLHRIFFIYHENAFALLLATRDTPSGSLLEVVLDKI